MASLNPSDPRLATIRALLAKAEATTFPAEAELFTAKASELMARHAIDEALLWASGPADSSAPVEIRIEIHRPFVAQKAYLVHRVAGAFGCQAIRLGRGSAAHGELQSVVGFPSDLDLVETLVTSLMVQLTSAMTSPAAALPGRTASQVAAWRRSFIIGFTASITDRLDRDRADATRAADAGRSDGPPAGASSGPARRPPSTSIVLADRAANVRDEFRHRHPHVRSSSVSQGTSRAGRAAGTEAGRRADIGSKRLPGRGALGRAG